MPDPRHIYYILGSFVAAIIATLGLLTETPAIYGILPGLIGGGLALIAAVRFLKDKRDLAGFVATLCGFVFYQAFQANPVTLPEFNLAIATIAPVDKLVGIFLGNFTTGLLLLACRIVGGGLRRSLPPSGGQIVERQERSHIDGKVFVGFLLVFAVVAFPNVVFGKVVVGAIKNIVYQRATWAETGEFSGFETNGGAVSGSLLNMTFWATSLFFLWLYLLGSRYRLLMLALSPLVLLWTASVALQGSRTYLVSLGFGLIVYYLGNPRFGARVFTYAVGGGLGLFALLQMSTLFRTNGLASFDPKELATHFFEIRGNEGVSSQMDGIEFFRTEMLEKGIAPNPLWGFARGMVERPIEGLLMPLPRSLFPWKPLDTMAVEFSLFYQNVRLGVPSSEAFLGASPGLMGRELIRYGLLGPITGLLWLGGVLALADRLYAANGRSDLRRITAAVLACFFMAEMRDWVAMWFLPFLPAMLIFGYAIWTERKRRIRQPRPARRRVGAPRRHLLASR